MTQSGLRSATGLMLLMLCCSGSLVAKDAGQFPVPLAGDTLDGRMSGFPAVSLGYAECVDSHWSLDGTDVRSRPGSIRFVNAQDPCDTRVGMMPAVHEGQQTWVMVAPYVWAPAMRGTVGIAGIRQRVDLTLPELIDLIPDLNGFAMAHVEVGKGRWGLVFDALLAEVSPTEPGPLGETVTVDVNVTFLEAMGMYRVLDMGTGRHPLSWVSVDLLGGVRYYQVDGGLTIVPILGPTIDVTQSEVWADLVIGARAAVTISPGLSSFTRVDFGGFGIGTSSRLAWNLEAGIEYECVTCPGASLLLGYRVFDVDESKNSGVEYFEFDMKMQGPFAALSFRF